MLPKHLAFLPPPLPPQLLLHIVPPVLPRALPLSLQQAQDLSGHLELVGVARLTMGVALSTAVHVRDVSPWPVDSPVRG